MPAESPLPAVATEMENPLMPAATQPVIFNMGCRHNKFAGQINVDSAPACEPDVVHDLENLPWPWETSVADLVVFNHSLEHMGWNPRIFLGMMQELYRICKPGAEIYVNVPHPRHDHFLSDPPMCARSRQYCYRCSTASRTTNARPPERRTRLMRITSTSISRP